MKRFKTIVVGMVLLATAAVATARLWYAEDIQFGTSVSATTAGLPLNAVNASKIPLTTGSTVEAAIVALQAQVVALQAAVTLKAPLDSPTFTGPVVLPATTTIGVVSGTEIAYLDNASSNLQAQITLRAPIASPHFTGDAIFDGEVTASQFNGSSTGDHYAHLGNDNDITIPANDNAGLIWFNKALGKWRVTVDNTGATDNLAVEP